MTIYKIDGRQLAEVALQQAHRKGHAAALAGEPSDSNPYATEITWKGKTYCPMADIRDEWIVGFNGE